MGIARRALVLDDMASMRKIVAALLKELGFDTYEAENGEKALQAAQSCKFDVILSDWNMPGMTGADFVRNLRRSGDRTPVIMITAQAERSIVCEMAQIGVQGYLLKPFKPLTLSQAIGRVMSMNRPTQPPH
ncbi:MAG: response regulator [Betaproteobacteria bacterium]|nr:response regulator [Betaproteobacteria bacterium]